MQFATHETADEVNVLEAYERLIHDAMAGDQTLFTSSEGIERLWEVAAELIEDPPLVHPYFPGSWGPDADARAGRALHLAAAVRTPLAHQRDLSATHRRSSTTDRPTADRRRATLHTVDRST